MDKPKRSFGRDVFNDAPKEEKSNALKKMLDNGAGVTAKEVDVRVKLTPSNIKHLDMLIDQLQRKGKGRYSRNDLIRVAISLLTADDF